MWWLIAAHAVILRRAQVPAVPSLEEYLGFSADEDSANATAFLPASMADAPILANGVSQNGTGSLGQNATLQAPGAPQAAPAALVPRIKCPPGVTANKEQLQWRLAHQRRVYATGTAAVQQTYVFVIMPPGYGSTALMSLLATSPNVGTLCSAGTLNCEGCWLLYSHGIADHARRWERDQPADWRQAVGVFNQVWPAEKPLKLEKSPNNVVKTKQIADDLTAAGHNVRFVVMTRSPCFLSTPQLMMGGGVHPWEYFAQEMIATLHRQPKGTGTVGAIHLRYEDLLADPYAVATQLLGFLPQLGSLDPTENPLTRLGGDVLDPQNTNDRGKSVVQYLLEYGHIPADHANVDPKYRALMQALGYPTQSVAAPPR